MYDHKDVHFDLNIKKPSAEYFSLPRSKKWFLWKKSLEKLLHRNIFNVISNVYKSLHSKADVKNRRLLCLKKDVIQK